MVFALLLAAALPAPQAEHDVAWAYAIRITGSPRDCAYWLTDASLDLPHLRETLRHGYDTTKGAEILVGPPTPAKCVRMARRALRQAGFAHVRLRAESR
jgi:hypothetical protein